MNIFIDIFTKKVIGINLTEDKISTFKVYLPDINPSKTIKQKIKKHKKNENGEFLYFNHLTNTEVTTNFEQKNNKEIYFKPILIEEEIETTYYLLDNPSVFTLEDIIKIKSDEILKNSGFSNIILFEELNEEDLSINLSTNLANTGLKTLKILPNGQCRTNKINLEKEVTKLKIYLESDSDIKVEIGKSSTEFYESIDNIVEFNEPVSQIYIKFKNLNDKKIQEVYCYGILF